MLDVHIDDFFKDTAIALLTGMQQFPSPKTLFIEDICGPDDMDEFGLHSPRHLAALGAIQWMKDEGFARFGAMDRQESVDDLVLTSKSFSRLLKDVPDYSQPLFRVLHEAIQDADSSLVRTLLTNHFLDQ